MEQNSAKRHEIINILSAHCEDIARFSVKELFLFESLARGDATEDSNADLLVEFNSWPGFDGYTGLKFYLEHHLDQPVDLAMSTTLKPHSEPVIEQEAVSVQVLALCSISLEDTRKNS